MSKPIPVQLDLPLRQRIEAISLRLGEAKSTIMRMAMRVGLDALEKAFSTNPADVVKLVSVLDSSKESSSSRYPSPQPALNEGQALRDAPATPPPTKKRKAA